MPSSTTTAPAHAHGSPESLLHRHLTKQAAIKRLKDVKRTMFAQCLEHAELARFSALFQVEIVEAGTVIFHQGAAADTFYIIRKGEVNMKFSDKESMMQTAVVGGGDSSFTKPTRRTVLQGAPGSPGPDKRGLKGGRGAVKRRANSMQVDSAETKDLLSTVSPSSAYATLAHLPPPPTDAAAQSRSKGSRPSVGSSAHSRFFSYASVGSREKKEEKEREKGDRAPLSPSLASTSSVSGVAPLTTQTEDDAGMVSARDASPSSSFALLATKSSGDFFGLEALRFGPHFRTCVCIAHTQCALLTLSSTAFHTFVDGLEALEKRKKLYDLVGDSIQACLQKMPYLSGVSAAKVSLLSSLFVWTTLPAQATLFVEGERDKKGNGLYFLYEGTIGVYAKDESGESRLLKELSPGVCFGELGLIIHLPRTATIKAHTHCLLLHLPHRSFHNFLHLTPEILTKFKEQIETYQLNVVYLLENDVISQYFFQHCAREYSTENLEFWWEAKEYRVRDLSPDERRREAERIMNLYITDSSPKQINLKGNTQKNILQALRTAIRPPPHSSSSSSSSSARQGSSPSSPRSPAAASGITELLYLEAENEIFNLLATDSFSRFKASPLFRECLTGDHLVLTRSGWRSLVDIHREFEDAGLTLAAQAEGDALPVIEVCSFNLTTSTMEWKQVLATQRFPAGRPGQRLFRMQGDGMDVVATGEHRMLTGRLSHCKLTAGSFDFELVRDLAGGDCRGGTTSTATPEHSNTRAVVRSAVNRQPPFQLIIPQLRKACDWWWGHDQQKGFLRFYGFWLADGHLLTKAGSIGVSQRQLRASAWLTDVLDEVFPRWWRRRRCSSVDAKGVTFEYIIRCPPLWDWLRLMSVGPPGYNAHDAAELRAYPHFKYEETLAAKELESDYGPCQGGSQWTQAAMLAAFRRGPVRRPCCECGDPHGERVICSGKACRWVDDITRAHPACVGRDDATAFRTPWFCRKPSCQNEAAARATTHPPASSATTPASGPSSGKKKPSRRSRAAADASGEESSDESEEEVEDEFEEKESDGEVMPAGVREMMPTPGPTRIGRVPTPPKRYAPAGHPASREEEEDDDASQPVLPSSSAGSARVAPAPPAPQRRGSASGASATTTRHSSVSGSTGSSRRRGSASLSETGGPSMGQGGEVAAMGDCDAKADEQAPALPADTDTDEKVRRQLRERPADAAAHLPPLRPFFMEDDDVAPEPASWLTAAQKAEDQQLDEQLAALALQQIDVGAGAECFFNAISHLLHGGTAQADYYRQMAAQRLEEDVVAQELWPTDADRRVRDAYLHSLRKRRTWAGGFELPVLSRCLQRRFVVHRLGAPPTSLGDGDEATTLHLAHVHGNRWRVVQAWGAGVPVPPQPWEDAFDRTVDDFDLVEEEVGQAAPGSAVAGAQTAATVVWNHGVWRIGMDGEWFHVKRWMGPNVAGTIANLSQTQAVALLEGFCRADGNWADVQFQDAAREKPTGVWHCTNSSFPLIHHLQLVGVLAGAPGDLSIHTKKGTQTKGFNGRPITTTVDHWALAFNFGRFWGADKVFLSRLAKPVDVSVDVDARGHYDFKDDGHVYDITVADNGNFLTQRLSMKRLRGARAAGLAAAAGEDVQDAGEGVRAYPVFVGNCLEEMHHRVRSSSVSGGRGGVGLDDGYGAGSASASPSTSVSLRESPETSPKSKAGMDVSVVVEEVKEADGVQLVGDTSARSRSTKTVIHSANKRRASGRKHSPISRSNTGMGFNGGVAGSGGHAAAARSPLRRTNTTARLSAQGPVIEHLLNAHRKEKEETKEPDARDADTARKERSPRRPLTLDIPGRDEDAPSGPAALRFSPIASAAHSSSPHSNAVEAASASFAVYLNSRKKAGPQQSSPPHPVLSLSIPGVSPVSPRSSPPASGAAFSPTTRAAAEVAARKRTLNAQLVAKALSAARGSLVDSLVMDNPASSARRKPILTRTHSTKKFS